MQNSRVLVFLIALAVPSLAFAQDDSQWGPSFGIMLGTFDSNELTKLDDVVEELTGFDTQLTGKSWDLCAARGRSGHSALRLCYTQVRVDDGGGFSDELLDALTRDVRIKGFKVDRMFRLGPSRWPVAPMATLHGGLGKLSGTVAATEYQFNFNPTTGQFVRGPVAEQRQDPIADYWPVFGNNWTFLGGFSLGATADLGSHATVNVGVYGMEFPGMYKGMVQFTYWPR
jgi:hypothetical protein